MSAIKHLEEDYQAFKSKLNGAAAHLVGEFDTLFGHLLHGAQADAGQLAHEAETAAEPVVETAEADAATLAKDTASEAAADVTGETKA